MISQLLYVLFTAHFKVENITLLKIGYFRNISKMRSARLRIKYSLLISRHCSSLKLKYNLSGTFNLGTPQMIAPSKRI